MSLLYNRFKFYLKFDKEVFSQSFPSFIIRSVLGNELKQFACILKRKQCEFCPLKFSCAYSYVFETPIKKDTTFLAGRDKGMHPFTIYTDRDVKQSFDTLELTLTLIGKGIEYFPYIFYALLKAGEKGLFRERMPYKIDKIESVDDNIVVYDGKDEALNLIEPKKYQFNDALSCDFNGKLSLHFLSPIRIKVNGQYTDKLTYKDILINAARRLSVLESMYGSGEEVKFSLKNMSEKKSLDSFRWVDYQRFSARQSSEMKLGGVKGEIEVEGEFASTELSILEGIEIFGLGKNTSFGFGKVKVKR